jgi:RNA 2',3'-cyclic 3'-phosphodiesterase
MRLFLALDLPQSFLAALVAWRDERWRELPDARLVAAAALHVTLVFLGNRDEADVERIAALCLAEPAGPFELRATEVTGLPSRRARLYARALEDAGGALSAWQAELSKRLHGAGLYEPEKRPFWAHVTLVRGKGARPLPRLEEPPDLPPSLTRPFAPERATLYRSTLTPRGAVYDALAEAPLASRDVMR